MMEVDFELTVKSLSLKLGLSHNTVRELLNKGWVYSDRFGGQKKWELSERWLELSPKKEKP